MRFQLLLTVLITTIPFSSSAQTSRPARTNLSEVVASQSIINQLVQRRIIRGSGKIFAGRVVKVEKPEADSTPSFETTRITFRVEEAIRGVRRGHTVQISEWGGLWQTGERYQVGEHVLLFLYPQSRLGLTSPVGRTMGRFHVDGAGRVKVNSQLDALSVNVEPHSPGRVRAPAPTWIEVRRLAAAMRGATGE